MMKLFSAFLTVAAISFQANAFNASQCVPTMTVEEAQAQYSAGMATASETLSQNYKIAAAEHNQANEASFARYNEQLATAEKTYAAEVREIKGHYNLGWQEALEAAAAKHNQSIEEAGENYAAETQENQANYLQDTESAKAEYQNTANLLTAQYNAAVCASR